MEEVRDGGMILRSHQTVFRIVEIDDQAVSRWRRDQDQKWPNT